MENKLDNISTDELKKITEKLELYNKNGIPLTEKQIRLLENIYEQVKMKQIFKFHTDDLIVKEENKHTK